MRYRVTMRVLSCLLTVCLLGQMMLPAAAAELGEIQPAEESTLGEFLEETGENVPVGEVPAEDSILPEESSPVAEDSMDAAVDSAPQELPVLQEAAASSVDLSAYMDTSTISGSTTEWTGLLTDQASYSYTIKADDGVFNPIFTYEGETYIVITNAAQLQAIGTGRKVVGGWGTVSFQREKVEAGGLLTPDDYEWTNPKVVSVSGGDFVAKSVDEIGVTTEFPEAGEVRVDDNTLTYTYIVGGTGYEYTKDANYLIANDIDLIGVNWTPWDYTGKIIRGDVTLTDGSHRNPVISNITVVEDGDTSTAEIDNDRGSSQRGVGFFGAIYSPSSAADVEPEKSDRPWWDIVGNLVDGLLGLVGGLLKTLGGLVTDVIGIIAGWDNIATLSVDSVTIEGITLQNVSIETDGLYQTTDANGTTVDNPMPVGGFAGQVAGDVTISNCHVEELKTISGQEQVGGFVGKTVGATEYLLHGTTSGLDKTLSGLGGVLDGTLDFLLPTDDLVGGLISKLGLRNLVPTQYKPAVFENCSVTMADSGAVTAQGDYAGGFAGKVQGTQLTGCSVSNLSGVTANANVGGFAGRIANAYLLGLLQGLGVNLVNFPMSSEVTNCTVSGSNLIVTSTATDMDSGTENALAYAGGFAGGIMASDVIYDGTTGEACGVTGLKRVSAEGSYVGGFAGYAGVGDMAEAMNLLAELLNIELNLKSSEDGTIEVGLGDNLTTLLDTLLGVNLNAGILSLIGLNASQLVGCEVRGDSFAVSSTSGNRVGGFVGYLHGGQVLEQQVEERYDRVQATDADGNLLFVNASAVTDEDGVPTGAIYARLDNKGNVIYEDVHGKTVTVTTVTSDNNDKIYNLYDTVYMSPGNNNTYTPALMSTFRDENWNAVTDADGKPIGDVKDLPGYSNGVVFPVYQQRTSAEGYVQFTYHYMGEENGKSAAMQVTLYRGDNGTYYTRNTDGTYTEFSNVNTENLSVDALQVSVEDSMVDTGNGTIVTTYIEGLGSVSGADYVGGVVGQAKLCSATDLLSNLTVVQYERFELNNVQLNKNTESGYTVTATGDHAGGAVGYAMGGDVVNVDVYNLASVQAASYAGGFGGQIIPGTVAGQDGSGLKLLGLISVSNLLTVINAVHTFVNDSSVSGIADGFTVTARNSNKNAAAGGFVAWSINSKFTNCQIFRLASVQADGYAGGFCAVADTGSIAGVLDKTFGEIDVSSLLGLSGVLSLLDTFPNRFTGCTVNTGSDLAYTVEAVPEGVADTPGERMDAQNRAGEIDASCGSAGGFLGYGTAVQIEDCANENLQSVDATSYAGGFGGYVTIGSVAQLGNAGILGKLAGVTGIAALLDCAVSIIKASHCQGTSGGYTVTAFDRVTKMLSGNSWNDEGMAGGFIGNFEGSHIEGCYANHIDLVRGEEYAGGFIGRMVPGDVAKAAEDTGILDSIIKIEDGLLSALQTMVPSVKNSYAKCVPCGGTVLAYGTDYADTTQTTTKIGVAGGYVGLNAGGQIWGNYDDAITTWQLVDGTWTQVTKHTAIVPDRDTKTADWSGNAAGHETEVYGTGQTCDILQILKVDASLYAGGYSGYTKAADLASLGNINLLDGLLNLSNLLSVGQVVVPTQRNTGITGPLRNVTEAQMDYFNAKNTDNKADFSKYYGYTVGHEGTEASGGYCGVMTTGVIEDSIAYDLISAEAIQQAGGFVGAMLTGGVAQADLESSLLGGLLSGVEALGANLLDVVNAIVPVIKTSGVYGYYSGSEITAHDGSAGGFAGTVKGGQIWGEDTTRPASPAWNKEEDNTATPATESLARTDVQLVKTYEDVSDRCFTKNLRSVTASGDLSDAGGFVGYMGAASVASLGGLGLLGGVVELPTNFLNLLSATVPTVYYADVSAVDDWGFYVSGNGGRSAGGFAGFLQGAQVGIKERPIGTAGESDLGTNITITGLRSVTGGDYAGGFFGYADAASTLTVSGEDEAGSADNFNLLQLLAIGDISAIELAKSYIYNSSVTGIKGGYQVETTNAYDWKNADWDESKDKAVCAGGFGGLLQAGIVRYCTANDLSLVSSRNYAGGFVARMGKSSILKADDVATTSELGILGDLLDVGLGVGDVFGSHIQDSKLTGTTDGYSVLAQGGHHEIAGGFVGYSDVCRIKKCDAINLRLVMSDEIAGGFMGAMSDAMLLSLDVGLLEKLLGGVTVGLDLIKANRSRIENTTVTGVDTWDGYDVYGGGSSATSDANTTMGYAGAFLGLNFGSTVTDGNTIYADTVKGAIDRINPYVGTEENTALLTNLQLDVLLKLIDFEGDLSKSEVVRSTFQTRSGNTDLPSDTAPVSHSGEKTISQLTEPYYVAANEADLMVPTVTHTLTVTKQLQYEDGAIPNIGDLDYAYTIQIYDSSDNLIESAMLHPGESMVLDNPAAGTYTIKEVAASVLPGNVTPSPDVTVEVTDGTSVQATVVNTVTAPGQVDSDEDGTSDGYAASSGKFVVNHIPTDSQVPEEIENPCEILNEVVEDSPLRKQQALAVEPAAVKKEDLDGEDNKDAS
ncbi:hypothetical protein [Flavonifractor sp. An112]|uniref:hypothetical protein n=1 Tax=Flavonifractor sp. An112 TaxID=1965544 RepID=UPI00117A5DEF|nr:hypothetical protein [Flavonifractor sp. An112]